MTKANTNTAKSATDSLKLLWSTGLFKSWKNQSQIVESLAGKGYNFSGPELGMALKRAKHLTRRGKRGSYEYIQKYPFIEDEK